MSIEEDLDKLLNINTPKNEIDSILSKYGITLSDLQLLNNPSDLKKLAIKKLGNQNQSYLYAALAVRAGNEEARSLLVTVLPDILTKTQPQQVEAKTLQSKEETLKDTYILAFENDDDTEKERLKKYNAATNSITVLQALDILHIRHTILEAKHCKPMLAITDGTFTSIPSTLERVVKLTKAEWQRKHRKLLNDTETRQTYKTGADLADEIISICNTLTLEIDSNNPGTAQPNAQSILKKIDVYFNSVDQEQANQTTKAAKKIDALYQLLMIGINLISEIKTLNERASNINKKLPAKNGNPFDKIDILPQAPLSALSGALKIDEKLITALRLAFAMFKKLINECNTTCDLLRNQLLKAENEKYDEEAATLLEYWISTEKAGTVTKLRALISNTSKSKVQISETKPKIEAISKALNALVDSSNAATNTNLETLLDNVTNTRDQKDKTNQELVALHQKYSTLILNIDTFVKEEQGARNKCEQLSINSKLEKRTWQQTLREYEIQRKAEELRNLIPQELKHWRALISGVCQNGAFDSTLFAAGNLKVLGYLGFPQTFTRPNVLPALLVIENEFKAFRELEKLKKNDTLLYPTDSKNDYVKTKNTCTNVDLNQKHYLTEQLKKLKEMQAAEVAADTEIKKLINEDNNPNQYKKDVLEKFVHNKLKTLTHVQALPLLNNFIRDEEISKRTLLEQKQHILNEDLNTLPGNSFQEKQMYFQHLKKTLSDYKTWLTLLPGTTEILGNNIYQDTIRQLNAIVQIHYNTLVARLNLLTQKYQDRFSRSLFFKPSQTRLDKITELLSYKDALEKKPNITIIEKYVLLLGAITSTHQNTLNEHIKGANNENNNFIRALKHITTSKLEEILKTDIKESCPFAVKKGFFGDVYVNLEAPIVTQAQTLYTASLQQ